MSTITLTSKNQLTLPKKIVDAFDLKKGSKFVVSKSKNAITLYPIEDLIDSLAGSLTISDSLKNVPVDDAIGQAKNKKFNKDE